LTLHRARPPETGPEYRLRIVRPVLGELTPDLRAAAFRHGATAVAWGDRPSIAGDRRVLDGLAADPALPEDFRSALLRLSSAWKRLRFSLPLRDGRRIEMGDPPAIMGVINATPDSFSDGGRHIDPGLALAAALQMEEDGAAIIDIGGESTRPGSEGVSAEEEWRRVEPVLRRIRGAAGVPISIDTTKADVARRALDAGADVINDVSALLDDPAMAKVAVETGAPVILMHRRGRPRDMQIDPRYDNVSREVYEFLDERIRTLEREGIDPARIVVDPGIGFGKKVVHNLSLLRDIDELRGLGKPVLVGASRKSFMGRLLSPPKDENSSWGAEHWREVSTLAAHGAAAQSGAAILRVHEVRSHRDYLRILWAIAGPDRTPAE